MAVSFIKVLKLPERNKSQQVRSSDVVSQFTWICRTIHRWSFVVFWRTRLSSQYCEGASYEYLHQCPSCWNQIEECMSADKCTYMFYTVGIHRFYCFVSSLQRRKNVSGHTILWSFQTPRYAIPPLKLCTRWAETPFMHFLCVYG